MSTTPGPFPPPRRDGNLLLVAGSVAVLLHLAAFLLPLPQARPAVAPSTLYDGPVITKTKLPPPKIENPPAVLETSFEYREELPVPWEQDTEPVFEDPPVPAAFDAPAVDVELELDVTDVPPPPAPAGPLSEATPDLELPVLLDRVKPGYPEIARVVGVPGRVLLTAIVDEEGRVVEIEVLSATRPDLGFSKAAIEAVSRWVYRPGALRGRPVAVRLTVSVDFSIH